MPRFPIGLNGKYAIPRLSATQLRAVYTRNPCPEVRELLWEIYRLRLLLLRANQFLEATTGGCANSTGLIGDIFRAELQGEPCIVERKAWDAAFFGPRELRQSAYARNRSRRD